jgi:hypothetical protein
MPVYAAQWRFIDFHGQKSSRQGRHKSIYKGDHHQRTKLIKVLSLILFFLPDVHLRGLNKVWMDELIIEEVWKQFMQKLVSEWSILIGYVRPFPLQRPDVSLLTHETKFFSQP